MQGKSNKRQSVDMYTMMVLYRKQNTQRENDLWECFRNVIRTNNSKKLSYCKPR